MGAGLEMRFRVKRLLLLLRGPPWLSAFLRGKIAYWVPTRTAAFVSASVRACAHLDADCFPDHGKQTSHRSCIRSGDRAIALAPLRQTEELMDPIKRPTRYQEMTDPQARPRYTGIPTFFRAPHTELLADTDIGVIGVPVSTAASPTAPARAMARGRCATSPRCCGGCTRTASPRSTLPAFATSATAGSNSPTRWKARWPRSPRSTRRSSRRAWCRCRSAAIIRSACRSCARSPPERPVGMIHIDAHCDTGDDYLGSRFHHGAPFRRATEEGLLDPKRVIQIGIRGTTNDPDMWGFFHALGRAGAGDGGVPRQGLALRGRGGAAGGGRRPPPI